MKKIISVIVFSIFLGFQFSKAGVNSVGAGGGLAELEFLFLFNNSQQVLNLCLQPENSICQLSASQKQSWEKLSQNVKQLQDQYTVVYDSEGSEVWRLNSNQLILNSKFLYDENGLPQTEAKILSLAVAIQLNLLAPDKNIHQLWNETSSSLQAFRFEKQTTSARLSQDIHFHRIHLSNKQQSLLMYVLEDAKKSIILNELIQSQLPDVSLNQLNLNQISSVIRPEKVIFYGLAFNGRRFKLEAFFKPGVMEIDTQRIRFQLSVE